MPSSYLLPESARRFYTLINILIWAHILTTILKFDKTITPLDPAFVNAELVRNVLVKSIFVGTFVCDNGWVVPKACRIGVVECGRTIDFDPNLSRDAAWSVYTIKATTSC